MEFPPEFLDSVMASGACSDYYKLCADYPLRLDLPPASIPFKEVLKAAKNRVSLTKIATRPGGSVFALGELPEGVEMNFILDRTSVETDFSIPSSNGPLLGTFATLCYQALKHSGGALPNPGYPRPEFHSLGELMHIFQGLDGILRKVAAKA